MSALRRLVVVVASIVMAGALLGAWRFRRRASHRLVLRERERPVRRVGWRGPARSLVGPVAWRAPATIPAPAPAVARIAPATDTEAPERAAPVGAIATPPLADPSSVRSTAPAPLLRKRMAGTTAVVTDSVAVTVDGAASAAASVAEVAATAPWPEGPATKFVVPPIMIAPPAVAAPAVPAASPVPTAPPVPFGPPPAALGARREGRWARRAISAVVALYIVLAVLYALRTPLWQSPDEPAHFNYVRQLGDGGGLPVLETGDWNAAYLEQLKSQKFPPELSVESVRYEFHQPPLYYVLATPAYWLGRELPTGMTVVLVRLVSIAFSAASLVVAFLIVSTLFPRSPLLQVGVPAFMALVPQRAHIAASVNNDALAELVIGLVLLAGVRFVRATAPAGNVSGRWIWALGALTGVALLTKTTIYAAIVVVPAAIVLANRPLTEALFRLRLGRAIQNAGRSALGIAGVVAVALAVGGWWFVRNAMVYGGLDVLGLQRHDQVVAGQPLARPLLEWLPTFAQVTFQSFWAQFGWMAVPASDYVYIVLATVTALAVAGALRFWQRAIWGGDYAVHAAMGVLLICLSVVVLQLVVYNLRFEQPQGRYLFPAMVPIAVFYVAGLAEVALLRPRGIGSALILVLAALLVGVIVQQNVPRSASPLLFASLLAPAGLALLLAALQVAAPRRSGAQSALSVASSLMALFALNVLSIVALLPYLYRA